MLADQFSSLNIWPVKDLEIFSLIIYSLFLFFFGSM